MNEDHELGGLLYRIQAGNGEAVDAVLAKIRPYLHLLVRQQLDPDLRQKLGDSDIVQESLVRIHGGLNPDTQDPGGLFRGQSSPEFLAWISQIVRHVIIDLERRGMARKRDERREVPGSKFLATLTHGTTPEKAAELAEQALHIAAALERLPSHKQEVLRLRFFEQLSFGEISQRMGKGVGALRVLCCRALDDLRSDGRLLGEMEASS